MSVSYSNDSVIRRISREEHVDVTTASRYFNELLVFLDLCAESDGLLSPPPAVDAAWHAFVLHTRDYEAYCTERYGRIIHHQPSDEPDPGAYRRAYDTRRKVDPPPDMAVWPMPPSGKRRRRRRGDTSGGWFGGFFAGGDGGGGGDSGGGDSGGGSSCGGSGCGGGGN